MTYLIPKGRAILGLWMALVLLVATVPAVSADEPLETTEGHTNGFYWTAYGDAYTWITGYAGPGGEWANKGDLNQDSRITTSDGRLTLQAAVSKLDFTPQQTARADVDNDGAVSVADARLILQAAVGKIQLAG